MRKRPICNPLRRRLRRSALPILAALAALAVMSQGDYGDLLDDLTGKADRRSAPAADGSRVIEGIPRIVDADTFVISLKTIRLHGVDAPEADQLCRDRSSRSYRCGDMATRWLTEWIGDQPVRCEQRDMDRYGRVIGQCFVGDEDMNAALVYSGQAVAYRQYSGEYIAAENAARRARRGIWEGSFDMPWDWRRR